MKKINVLIVTLTFLLTACSNSDNASPLPDTSQDELLGTWTATAIDISGDIVALISGQSVTTDIVGEGFDIDYIVTFSASPNNVVSQGTSSIEFSYSIFGQATTETIEDVEILDSGTWEKNGNQITISSNGEVTTLEILQLTANSLRLGLETVEDLSEPGTTITANIDAELSFTK